MFSFKLEKEDKNSSARAGVITTPHGVINTPMFMPVGTVGSVKGVAPDDLNAVGAEIILGNTYHLHLRPGEDTVASFGGLASFNSWNKPTLTDSGGFQVFSLAKLNSIKEEGVAFRSHLDGSKLFLSPETSIGIQEKIGADIMMAFDECPPYPSEHSYMKSSVERTTRWAKRCLDAKTRDDQALFGIVQGGIYDDLRKQSASDLLSMDFNGYAVGGVAVGEPVEEIYRQTEFTAGLLPKDKPRYLMGVGTPENIINCISHGIDMFDCVMPTRNARNGMLFTSNGRVNIKRSEFKLSDDKIDEECDCYTCRTFSRGYLRHLFTAKEILSYRLNSIHNLHYYISLVKKLRRAILSGDFANLKCEILAKYNNK